MPHNLLTVLIADDESTIRNGLLEAIPWDFFHAQVIGTAQDGISALSYIKQHRPDLVIIDIKMPGIDGLEVIRRSKADGITSRFLILSGYNDFCLAQKAIRYGANGYFLKPLKIEEFKDELAHQFSEILAQKHSSAAHANLEVLMRTSRIFFLNQLIMNEIRSTEELTRRYSVLSLKIEDAPLCVVVCTAAVSDPALLSSALEEAEASLARSLSGFPCEAWTRVQDQVIVLVNMQADTVDSVLRQLLEKTVYDLKQQTGLRFFAGIGRSVSGLEQASVSYNSALRALSYHIFEKEGDVYDSSIICRQEPSFNPESIPTEPLLTAIEGHCQDAISDFCASFLRSLFFVPMPPPDFIRGMCIYLVSNVRLQFFSRHPGLASVSPVNGEETRLIHSMTGLHGWLVSTFSEYSRRYLEAKENSDPVIEAAKQFIQENLSTNIKARDIAAKVNLSESYFTVYFKSKTGQNFRDYVLNARMEYAKKLLSEQKMNVSEIAYATGYQDYRSFSRAFKNVTGISPSDYQNL